MDCKWSIYIQTSEELYRSRSLQFHKGNKNLWLNALLTAKPFIRKDIEIIEEVELDWGRIYIVNTPETFRTALVEKYGLLWRNPVSFTCNKATVAQDKLKTIGYMNYTNNKHKQIPFLGICNEDPEVTSIHITREDGKIFTHPAPLNELN